MPPAALSFPNSVAGWLAYIESLHPATIEMGLSRVREVADRLNLRFNYLVITVGGTNGKGSTCAMLERIYTQAGYQVGCYTSPHLLQYQERVRFNGQLIADTLLCDAFLAVEQRRGEIALTYFEMGTLAALWAFEQAGLDIAILEVGLGGRLDAVNIVDADCAIVTNVDLDHMEFLGNTREAIGFEKAGIYRAQQVAICGDLHPPSALLTHAQQLNATLARNGVDFSVTPQATAALYQDAQGTLLFSQLALQGAYQWQNAASVIYAVRALQTKLKVDTETLVSSISMTQVTGRFQYWHHAPDIILDVAHNPHAARALRHNLETIRAGGGRVYAVFSMLADKDIPAVIAELHSMIDVWAIAPIVHPRAAKLDYLLSCLQPHVSQDHIHCFERLAMALSHCYNKATKNDKIIVFGSFFTVAAILQCTSIDALES